LARIRTIKPEFFRHEKLQDLEAAHPGKHCMLVFAGLWGHCDKAGRFEYRPRTLKLDILPFLDFNMRDTLALLESAGFIRCYIANDKQYAEIPSFTDHQRIGGKEAQEPERFPPPVVEASGKYEGSDSEAFEKQQGLQEGKGREGKGREGDVGLKPAVSPLSKNAELRKTASQVIAFLNEKAGRNYDLNGANADHVIGRLKDGESVEDLRAVVAKKCRDWRGDEKMRMYLRPETLFNRTKFASYKGELNAVS
jgi:uncharacterized phage protein (TIGR02220 family)